MTQTRTGESATLVNRRVATVAPFPCLALATFLEYTAPDAAPPGPVTLVLALVTAGWLGGMPLLRRRNTVWSAGYILGLLALMTALVVASPWFSFVAWAPMVQSFVLFELRWVFLIAAGVAGVSTATAGAQLSRADSGSTDSYILFGANLLAPLLIAGWALGRESQSRRELITELDTANSELRTALADNESLQRQLLDQAHATGVEQERQRLAREIHDTLAQSMSAISTQLESALHSTSDDWCSRATQARDLAREGLSEARRSIHALGPPALIANSLPEALADLAAHPRPGIEVRYETVGDAVPLTEPIETALLRVAQEAVHNAAKHARASLAHVTLSFLDDEVLLDVRDNGVGVDAAGPSADSGGHGIPAMRQRMRQIQGRLDIESSDTGTAVCVAAPIPVRETT